MLLKKCEPAVFYFQNFLSNMRSAIFFLACLVFVAAAESAGLFVFVL
jgi:hypothetical protein